MSSSLFSDLFALSPPVSDEPTFASGEYSDMSVEDLLAMVPSLRLDTFKIAFGSGWHSKDEWEIAWSFECCYNSVRSKNLHKALLQSFEHLQLERVRLGRGVQG